MWNELPFDILSHIFSFLPPNSLAHAICVCKHWHYCSRLPAFPPRFLSWFLAMPFWRPRSTCCYARDPDQGTWYSLPMDFTAEPILLVSYLTGGLVLCRFASPALLRLAVCNPFTRQILALPDLLASRYKPVIGVITGTDSNSLSYYIVIVAGGTYDASYESTLEMYDSRRGGDGWRLVGPMPIEFAVRLTVWTPNESVHTDDGFLYWITSARAYSVVRLDLACWAWREVKLPMADRLDWAAIFKRRNGRLGLMGGSVGAMGQVWELDMQACDEWRTVSTVPSDLDMPFGRGSIKCAGAGDAAYLYSDLGSDMLVWSETEGKEGWNLVEGRSNSGINFSFFKAVSIHPSLSRSLF
ncbi:Galactose oxidase/kelch repeat superfamily protein [Rhynchospora pubera]|uniref:Galactose oxidase/kelch repeat superfamily protein n=1 Tax=Rhynchospora pubera TaxID=906938 RepID=A0AAV8EH04_9POAL|nr:Galactose oxidase/kelch repeat superfamily protein [Rhynchospora pubera]